MRPGTLLRLDPRTLAQVSAPLRLSPGRTAALAPGGGYLRVTAGDAGDVLRIDVIGLVPRAPYGVISNRHGKGALPGEFPETPAPEPGADAAHPDLFHNVSTFTPVRR